MSGNGPDSKFIKVSVDLWTTDCSISNDIYLVVFPNYEYIQSNWPGYFLTLLSTSKNPIKELRNFFLNMSLVLLKN